MKRSLKTIGRFPTIILTPLFTFWVIGPKGPYSFKTWCCGGSREMEVSFLHTWINSFIMVFGHLIYILVRENPFDKGVSVYKLRFVFVVIHETLERYYIFFQIF